MAGAGAHLRARVRAASAAAALGLLVAFSRPSPPARTLAALADMLGRSVHGVVRPSDVSWEPGSGFLSEALLGRRVLFLAAAGPDAARDVYRARVRVSAEGQPIDVAALHDLTETPLADESGLDLRGNTAVFATTAFGRVQGITALELGGVASQDRPSSLVGRTLLALSSYRRTGSLAGIGRTDLVLDTPARSAKVLLAPPSIHLDVDDPSQSLDLDLSTVELRRAAGTDTVGLRIVRQDYRQRSPLAWSVDLVRDLVGATPVAWLEATVFGARDLVKRAGTKLFRWSGDSRLKKDAPPPSARVLRPAELAGADTGWPPPPIPSLWETPKVGEGQWSEVAAPWLPRPSGAAGASPPPYFYTTFIRPDPERPYTEVLLVAMDMRQLELGMEGGYEEPKPVAGPPGTGRIPRASGTLPRVVAAFNGAFKAEHGGYGMMVARRVLLPPVPGAATVVVTEDGRTGFGSWPRTGDTPPDVVSFRQNLDPLVDGSALNPAGRSIWGFQVAGETSLTERTAVCLTPAGHVYYAWGRDISGHGLARALKQAGCDYAVHLDMNPRHCGFVFMNAPHPDGHDAHYQLADSGMSINPSRYFLGSDKDFFYVMLRRPGPFVRDAEASAEWSVSPGTQPPPTWLPGVYESTKPLGELSLRVLSFEAGRVDWVVRAGTEEPGAPGARPKKIGLEAELEGRVVSAIGLGHTTEALRYGLAFDGKASLELRKSYATLVLAPGRAPRIETPGERSSLAEGEEAVQLPLLARGGVVDGRASDRGGSRQRGALCVTSEGRVLVALGKHDSSDPLASALVDAGCREVVGLDRGSRHPAFVQRTGTADAPLSRYETSVLYAVMRPMTPHGFRWR
jgi:hypothetical protein